MRALLDIHVLIASPALAVKHKGTLATFEQNLPLSAVPGAGAANLSGL